MQKIKTNHGGFYHYYASGNGSVSFVHADHKGNATSEIVPLEAAEALKPDGWIVINLHGYLHAYNPVTRKNENTLIMDNVEYSYIERSPIAHRKYHIFIEESGKLQQIQHISTVASLEFFLNNEVILNMDYYSDLYHGRKALDGIERIITDKATGAIYYIPVDTPLNDDAITQAIEEL